MKLRAGMSWFDLKKIETGNFYHPDLLGRKTVHTGRYEVSAGHHPLTTKGLHHHLKNGSMSFLTAHNPSAQKLSPEENANRNAQLEADLNRAGAVYHKVKGKYGGHEEDSFMVHHTDKVKPEHLEALAQKYGQESILHGSMGKYKLKYVTGENAGKHHPGYGHTINPKAKDNYSHLPNLPQQKFSANINFDELKLSEKAARRLSHYEIETAEGETHQIHIDLDYDTIQ